MLGYQENDAYNNMNNLGGVMNHNLNRNPLNFDFINQFPDVPLEFPVIQNNNVHFDFINQFPDVPWEFRAEDNQDADADDALDFNMDVGLNLERFRLERQNAVNLDDEDENEDEDENNEIEDLADEIISDDEDEDENNNDVDVGNENDGEAFISDDEDEDDEDEDEEDDEDEEEERNVDAMNDQNSRWVIENYKIAQRDDAKWEHIDRNDRWTGKELGHIPWDFPCDRMKEIAVKFTALLGEISEHECNIPLLAGNEPLPPHLMNKIRSIYYSCEECNCCNRHLQDRPERFGHVRNDLEYSNTFLENDEKTNRCICPCRHIMRVVCYYA